MSSLLTTFRNENTRAFVEGIQDGVDNYYIFTGRTQSWPDESDVPEFTDTLELEVDARNSLNGLKKIEAADVAFGIRRIDWSRDRIFAQYDSTENMSTKDFYVMTEQNNVYKCISNNNNSRSTSRPVHTTTQTSFEIDGYKWKYMFTISDELLDKFIVPGFLPIGKNETVETNAIPGTIDNVKIVSTGTGYRANASVELGSEIPVFIEGDGDQNSSAVGNVTTSQGAILNIAITNFGQNYPFAPEQRIPVAFRQVNPTGVIQSAYGVADTDDEGKISSVQIVISGNNYVNAPVNIVQSNCRSFAETDGNGIITNVDIFTGREGQNFTQAKAIPVDSTGTGAVLVPLISPFEGHGSNPDIELFGNFAMINLRLAGDDTFIDIDEFRQVGLIKNPIAYDSLENPVLITDDTLDAKWRLTLNQPTSTFELNENTVALSSGTRGSNLNILDENTIRVSIDRSLGRDFEFIQGESIRGINSNSNAAITQIQPPDIENLFGEILYINNREVITRDFDLQVETLTLVIQY